MRTGNSAGRILLVTRNFPPLLGGMERLNWHLAGELSKCHEVRVVGPQGAGQLAPPGVEVHEVPVRPLARFLPAAGWQTLRIARAFSPAVVLAGSGLVAPLAWTAARASGARAAAFVHGLDISVPNPVYQAVWPWFLRRMDRLIANSRATAALAADAGVPAARIGVVHPGVRLPAPDPQARARFRARHGLGDDPVLLSVGRFSGRKGLREFATEVLPLISAGLPDVRLVIMGDCPANALFGQAQSPDSIRAAAEIAGTGSRLCFLGAGTDQELADAYSAADVHVFPVRHIPGDPEGFGMVAIEAAAHGLPTVAYATGGVPESVAEGLSGRLVAPGDAPGFAQAVLDLVRHPLPAAGVRGFAERFEWTHFGAALCAEIEACCA